MLLTDKVSNFCSLITQAQLSNKSQVIVPQTKYNESIVRALLREGLIKSYFYNKANKIILNLKYTDFGDPLIKRLVRESKSKKHTYLSVTEIKNYKKANLFFLTTTKGVVSNYEAIVLNQGGKIIFSVIS